MEFRWLCLYSKASDKTIREIAKIIAKNPAFIAHSWPEGSRGWRLEVRDSPPPSYAAREVAEELLLSQPPPYEGAPPTYEAEQKGESAQGSVPLEPAPPPYNEPLRLTVREGVKRQNLFSEKERHNFTPILILNRETGPKLSQALQKILSLRSDKSISGFQIFSIGYDQEDKSRVILMISTMRGTHEKYATDCFSVPFATLNELMRSVQADEKELQASQQADRKDSFANIDIRYKAVPSAHNAESVIASTKLNSDVQLVDMKRQMGKSNNYNLECIVKGKTVYFEVNEAGQFSSILKLLKEKKPDELQALAQTLVATMETYKKDRKSEKLQRLDKLPDNPGDEDKEFAAFKGESILFEEFGRKIKISNIYFKDGEYLIVGRSLGPYLKDIQNYVIAANKERMDRLVRENR